MKMKEKQKERLIQILEVLKQQNCIKSYTVIGEDVGSVVPEWMAGGVNRVFDEVSKPARRMIADAVAMNQAVSSGGRGTDWTLLAAIETLFLIPVFLVTFFLQNHLLRGVTFGTVKR